jgi:hypothetical protein
LPDGTRLSGEFFLLGEFSWASSLGRILLGEFFTEARIMVSPNPPQFRMPERTR